MITGASSGMGKLTAKLLAKSGNYTVYGAARRMEKMDDLKSLGVTPVFMDVTKEDSMVAAVGLISKAEGHIDILINDAGFGQYGTIEDVPIDDAKRQLDVNLFGAVRLIQLVLPYMREKGQGKIVNITSIGGKISTSLGGWYFASKHAFEAVSDALRNEVKPFGIDVIIIEPGIIKTAWPGIAVENMRKVSVHTAYKDLIEKGAVMLNNFDLDGSDSEIIAQLIKKVIEVKNPKPRYAKGYLAGSALFAKRWFSDRLFDKVIMKKGGL